MVSLAHPLSYTRRRQSPTTKPRPSLVGTTSFTPKSFIARPRHSLVYRTNRSGCSESSPLSPHPRWVHLSRLSSLFLCAHLLLSFSCCLFLPLGVRYVLFCTSPCVSAPYTVIHTHSSAAPTCPRSRCPICDYATAVEQDTGEV